MKPCIGVLILAGLLWSPSVRAQQRVPAQEEKKTQPAGLRNLTVDDYFQIKRVQDPQLSPDGKWAAYTVTALNLQEDKSESQIWMAPIGGGGALPMTSKDKFASRPRWSPDGKYLAFLASRGEDDSRTPEAKTQVWLLHRQGGDAQRWTEFRQGVTSFEWAPDGTKMVLAVKDPTPEEAASEKEKEGEKAKPKTPRPWVVDRLQFKRDTIGYLDRRRTHLYVFDLASKKLTQITSGDYDDSEPDWSPDGRFIAFVSNRTENPDGNFNTDIWVVAADNPDQGKTLVQVSTNAGADTAPAWSPDGKWIVYVSQTDARALDYATQHLAVAPAQGGAARVLSEKLDRNVLTPRFSPDGKWIYLLLEDSGEQHLARIPAAGGEVTRPIIGRRSVVAFALGKDGTVVTQISEPRLPGELFVLEAGKLRQLTTTNDAFLAQIRLAEVEKVRFHSKDGTRVEGFVYQPPAFNPELRHPALLRIHGGPVSQYDFSFSFEAQLFAAHGYVVVMTNPRGSSGYGQSFSQAIFATWGEKDYEDVVAGVDYAIEKGYADPKRLGVGGWSYGGILTNYVITQTDRFKAAISGASEVLYVANYGHDHYQKLWELELGLPWKNRELWERLSPFNYVEKIVTPTLIICGEKDWNVPVLNSEQLYQALKRLGRSTELVVYPGESHSIRKPAYIKDRFERYLAWYDKYVKGEPPDAAKPVESPKP